MTRQRGRLTVEQQRLCAPLVPLAYAKARQVWEAYSRRPEDYDELRSEALVKLTEAAYFYEPGKGDFVSFAGAYVFNQLRGIQGNWNKKRKAHKTSPLNPEGLVWKRDALSERVQEKLSWVLDALSSLRPRLREALQGAYGLGRVARRVKDLASEMGISQSGVQMHLLRARKSLRDRYLREKSA